MQEMLTRKQVLGLFLTTMAGFSLFAFLTPMESLGLSAARRPEVWELSRYGIVAGWLLIAALIYLARGFQSYSLSLSRCAISSGRPGGALATAGIMVSGWISH